MKEEPEYRQFKGVCRKCGKEVIYYNSVKRHPDYIECDECEKADILETLTGQKVFGGVVKGSG